MDRRDGEGDARKTAGAKDSNSPETLDKADSFSNEPPPSPSSLFERSENVLVKFNHLIYEAKVVDMDVEDQITYVKVHYNGWSKKRDDWFSEKDGHLLKRTETNLKTAEQLRTSKITNLKGPSGFSGSGQSLMRSRSFARAHSRGGKRAKGTKKLSPFKLKMDQSDLLHKTPSTSAQLRSDSPDPLITIPEKLKQFLVNDAQSVTQTEKAPLVMFPVPASRNINNIIKEYVTNPDDDDARDLSTGLKEYFNHTVKQKLLFRIEHVQLEEFEKKYERECQDVPELSSVFGAPHLLRLFTILASPGPLDIAFGSENVSVVINLFEKFLEFLQINFDKYFVLNGDAETETASCSDVNPPEDEDEKSNDE